jgi:hypothetical protein
MFEINIKMIHAKGNPTLRSPQEAKFHGVEGLPRVQVVTGASDRGWGAPSLIPFSSAACAPPPSRQLTSSDHFTTA